MSGAVLANSGGYSAHYSQKMARPKTGKFLMAAIASDPVRFFSPHAVLAAVNSPAMNCWELPPINILSAYVGSLRWP